MQDSHVPTPYQCSNKDFRNKEHPYHWYITTVPQESYRSGNEEDGEDPDGCYEDGASCVGLAVVMGNATSAPLTQHTAEFIVRACNAHDDLLAACKAVVETDGFVGSGLMGIRIQAMKKAIAEAERGRIHRT